MVASSPLSPSNLKTGILLLLGFCYLLPLVNTQELCQEEDHAIYAADNLPNGTIRLYSKLSYWDLELYHYELEKDKSFPWWNPFAKMFPQSYKLLVNSEEFQLSAFIDDKNPEDRLIFDVYHGLNFSLADSKTLNHVMVSFSDWRHFNYTYLFETNNASLSAINRTGRFILWNSTSGNIVKKYDVYLDHSADIKLFITGAINVYLNETQHLFLFLNSQFFIVNYLDSNQLHPELDVDNLYHRGKIPHSITASFTIQASADRIWIVLIRCSDFCLVPWNYAEKFFDFNQCVNNGSWKSLKHFFFSNGNIYENMKPFQSYYLSPNLTQLNVSTDFGRVSSPFLDNPKNTETPWTLFSKYSFTFLMVVVIVFSVLVFYFVIDRHHSASYNLKKKEEEAKKRLEMDGIQDDESARMPSMILVEEVNVANQNETANAAVAVQVEEETSAEDVESEV